MMEDGGGEPPPGTLSFVDAFGETVGATTLERADAVGANCEDLNSTSRAIYDRNWGRSVASIAYTELQFDAKYSVNTWGEIQ